MPFIAGSVGTPFLSLSDLGLILQPAPQAMPSLEVQPDTVSYSLGATEWRWANALIQAT